MTREIGWLSCIGGVAVVSALVCVVGCGSGPVPAPTAYAEFNSEPGTFACDYPEGWEAKGGGAHGIEWAKFTSGPAEIRIDAGKNASMLGDIASSAAKMDGVETPEEAPVLQVHLAYSEDIEESFSGYKEVGAVEEIDIQLGPARRNEFTAKSSFGTGLHGYRATALTRDKGVFVTCVCPESDWKTLQPAFDHVLLSLKRGTAP
jgi:hypothetical protein